MAKIHDVDGFCPACGGRTLHLMPSGMLQCLARACPDPGAALKILSEREIHHIVMFHEDSWSAVHPLYERIGGVLLDCPALRGIDMAQEADDRPPGRYRVAMAEGEPTWELLDEPGPGE